eukprot:CAMPEP_0202429818 /NCGR_PEP_ID=MMETSP1345-20130828/3446_1 /ASSEMBLY_ACC=CAM_ASM_000843 /TAXON_ID=342563 /ORGANISM="Fabrea Fabrea salina" /LENGTH=122 /DNA_ID=CAMNT_0049041151 /DNA_START=26 /DNA_END=391 /DNA_ORIENTATION=-
MLSEDQIFEAKRFLRSYKDALSCIRETAEKKAWEDYYSEFYQRFKQAKENKEIEVEEKGDISHGENFRTGYFYKVNKFAQDMLKQTKLPETKDFLQASSQFDQIISDLKNKIYEANQTPRNQ